MSPNTLSTVINARLGDAAIKDSSIIIKYLKDLCNAGKNKHVWRTQFDSCDQRQNQSIDNWLYELRDLSGKCEFEVGCHLCETERLLGRIVNGVTDNDVRIKLLEVGPNLLLDQAIVIVRTSEMSKLEAEQIHPGGSVESIQKLAYKKAKSFKVTEAAAAAYTKANHGTSGATCDKCGFEIRPGGHNCPAKNDKCNKCDQISHFKSVYPVKGKLSAIYVNRIASTKEDTVALHHTQRRTGHLGTHTDRYRINFGRSSAINLPQPFWRCTTRCRHSRRNRGNHIQSLGSFKASLNCTANDGSSRHIE
jgi:predicted Zn-ribbon and HTH transcriptional regulator